MTVSIAPLNINGLRDVNKRLGFLRWLSHFSLDIVCLQETHSLSTHEVSSWFSSLGYSAFVSPGTSFGRGTAVLFKASFVLIGSFCDVEGLFVTSDFSFRDKVFRVVSLYAPNDYRERNNFLSFVMSNVDPAIHTLLCGDFNSVFDRSLDRCGSDPSDYGRESTVLMSALFREACVVDAWRHCHPTSKSFTWTKWDGSISSRIDLIGVPNSWVSFISSSTICPCPFSDHSMVSPSFSTPERSWSLEAECVAFS